jgi:hypothetical protein
VLQCCMQFNQPVFASFKSLVRETRKSTGACVLTVLTFSGLLACSTSCGEKSEPEATRPQSTIPVKSYTTRGIIEAMPTENRPGTQFIVQHEEIPDFLGSDGRVGMKKMAMPFPLGEGVLIDGYNVGDHVVIDFTVDWNKSPAYWVTEITKAEPVEQENTESQR